MNMLRRSAGVAVMALVLTGVIGTATPTGVARGGDEIVASVSWNGAQPDVARGGDEIVASVSWNGAQPDVARGGDSMQS